MTALDWISLACSMSCSQLIISLPRVVSPSCLRRLSNVCAAAWSVSAYRCAESASTEAVSVRLDAVVASTEAAAPCRAIHAE